MKKRMLVCLLMMLLAVFSVAAAEETRIPVAENDRLALSLSVDLCGWEALRCWISRRGSHGHPA